MCPVLGSIKKSLCPVPRNTGPVLPINNEQSLMTVILALKLSCLSAVEGLERSRRLRTLYQTAYLPSVHKILLWPMVSLQIWAWKSFQKSHFWQPTVDTIPYCDSSKATNETHCDLEWIKALKWYLEQMQIWKTRPRPDKMLETWDLKMCNPLSPSLKGDHLGQESSGFYMFHCFNTSIHTSISVLFFISLSHVLCFSCWFWK